MPTAFATVTHITVSTYCWGTGNMQTMSVLRPTSTCVAKAVVSRDGTVSLQDTDFIAMNIAPGLRFKGTAGLLASRNGCGDCDEKEGHELSGSPSLADVKQSRVTSIEWDRKGYIAWQTSPVHKISTSDSFQLDSKEAKWYISRRVIICPDVPGQFKGNSVRKGVDGRRSIGLGLNASCGVAEKENTRLLQPRTAWTQVLLCGGAGHPWPGHRHLYDGRYWTKFELTRIAMRGHASMPCQRIDQNQTGKTDWWSSGFELQMVLTINESKGQNCGEGVATLSTLRLKIDSDGKAPKTWSFGSKILGHSKYQRTLAFPNSRSLFRDARSDRLIAGLVFVAVRIFLCQRVFILSTDNSGISVALAADITGAALYGALVNLNPLLASSTHHVQAHPLYLVRAGTPVMRVSISSASMIPYFTIRDSTRMTIPRFTLVHLFSSTCARRQILTLHYPSKIYPCEIFQSSLSGPAWNQICPLSSSSTLGLDSTHPRVRGEALNALNTTGAEFSQKAPIDNRFPAPDSRSRSRLFQLRATAGQFHFDHEARGSGGRCNVQIFGS
ncbi:hypothetical protein K438DRAFT_1771419 [Mycena galopus ATCC 62051]|nr:hypothetical protein K438DRAFT_1771419 [Mycena galopus ATCC 62051]